MINNYNNNDKKVHIFYPRLVTETPFENTKIISYGLIVYAINTKRVIVVQRLHSVESLLILTGYYRPSLIPLLLPNTTLNEHDMFKKLIINDKQYYTEFCINHIGLDEKDVEYGYVRFLESKNIIDDVLSKNPAYQELKWTWPKGRLSPEDKNDGLLCAIREFTEEVEITLPPPVYISNDYIITETIKTLSCKMIETRCWVYVIDHEPQLPLLLQHKEVNDRQWIEVEQASILLKQPNLLYDLTYHLNQIVI
ncbi:MAG TPA: NUDIX hydrolase [Candidatus Saccharimonadales bacterium]|nr:NUDIX hydrolase [Candidatus Saccharimonadales bacterium]